MKTEKPLFIPLNAEMFEKFADGSKTIEYRKFTFNKWRTATCWTGRRVVLSYGFGKQRRLSAVVDGFAVRHSCDCPKHVQDMFTGLVACIYLKNIKPI